MILKTTVIYLYHKTVLGFQTKFVVEVFSSHYVQYIVHVPVGVISNVLHMTLFSELLIILKRPKKQSKLIWKKEKTLKHRWTCTWQLNKPLRNNDERLVKIQYCVNTVVCALGVT